MVREARLGKMIHDGITGKQTYTALDTKNQRTIAIKIVPIPSGASEEEMTREGRIAFALTHENIVLTDMCYINSGCLFMHMEYLEGDHLCDYLRKKRMITMEEALQIMNGICWAMDYMHSKNITHGDIHEGTVMIDESGEIKVLCFGRALEHSGNSKLLDRYKTRDNMQVHNLWKCILRFVSDGAERISAQNLDFMINEQ